MPYRTAALTPPSAPQHLRALLYRWFVLFNPLYLASALCVLVGVWLVSESLTASGSVYGDLWLAGVIELYQAVLVGGVALLYRGVRQARPAVMLALLALTYACDPTFRVENAAPLGLAGTVTTLGWVALSYARFAGLLWALRLSINARGAALLGAGVLWLAVTPQLLAHLSGGHEIVLLVAYGSLWALVLGFRAWRPAITSADALTAWGETVLRQSTRAAWYGFVGFGLYHLASWHMAHGISASVLHITTAMLVVTYWPRREQTIWWITGLAFAVGLLATRYTHATALLAAVMLLVNGARICGPRLYLGAVVAAWLSLRFQHPVMPHSMALDLVVGALYLLVTWRFSLVPEAVLAVGLGAVFGALRFGGSLRAMHLTRMQWGGALLASGFGLLFAGLFVNWKLPPVDGVPPPEPVPEPFGPEAEPPPVAPPTTVESASPDDGE